jgi:hypothetical protein
MTVWEELFMKAWSLWVLFALLLAAPAAAQQGTTELRGRVVDAQGAVLPGVTVTVPRSTRCG